MRKLLIKKNKRRPFPYFGIYIPKIFLKNKDFSMKRQFKFTESCLYHFEDENQHDINKLYGFSIGLHHRNSVRFGWRPTENLDKIEIVSYEYVKGKRLPATKLLDVRLNRWYSYELHYSKNNSIEYIVYDEKNKKYSYKSLLKLKCLINFGYKLKLYFGGNYKAPHDMIIYKK